jgi:hypothetical protein
MHVCVCDTYIVIHKVGDANFPLIVDSSPAEKCI